jgi:hypothetical protein
MDENTPRSELVSAIERRDARLGQMSRENEHLRFELRDRDRELAEISKWLDCETFNVDPVTRIKTLQERINELLLAGNEKLELVRKRQQEIVQLQLKLADATDPHNEDSQYDVYNS